MVSKPVWVDLFACVWLIPDSSVALMSITFSVSPPFHYYTFRCAPPLPRSLSSVSRLELRPSLCPSPPHLSSSPSCPSPLSYIHRLRWFVLTPSILSPLLPLNSIISLHPRQFSTVAQVPFVCVIVPSSRFSLFVVIWWIIVSGEERKRRRVSFFQWLSGGNQIGSCQCSGFIQLADHLYPFCTSVSSVLFMATLKSP